MRNPLVQSTDTTGSVPFETRQQRNWRVDFYRAACMFGVCLLHALDQGGYADAHRGLDNLMTPSVVGFVFISGYFGIRFKIRRIFSLLVTALCCFFVAGVVRWVWSPTGAGVGVIINQMQESAFTAWFLWMYLALVLTVPLLEPLFERVESAKTLFVRIFPFLIIVFGWSYLCFIFSRMSVLIPMTDVRVQLPITKGFGAFSVLTFIGVYVVSRFCRVTDVGKRLSLPVLLTLAVVSGIPCWAGMMHYNSPFALVFAGCVFFMFDRLPEMPRLGKLCTWLSPSIFSVFLMHANPYGTRCYVRFEQYLISDLGWNYYLACFVVATTIFGLCLALDLPRRGITCFYKRCV